MDHLPHFHREVTAFAAAARRAARADGAPPVPSCPGWSVSDLILHLGNVHRYVRHLLAGRYREQPDPTDPAFLRLPADLDRWPRPEDAPNHGPVPGSLLDWFGDAAAALEAGFRECPADETVWTWSREQTAGFWLRMQTIEAAVHRWDAESAVGEAGPVDAGLAADAVAQTFEVMAPARRAWRQAPPGAGERFGFRQTDGTGRWSVRFDGAGVHLTSPGGPADAGTDVELAGTASDLMLFLWGRVPADRLETAGDRAVLDRYFTLVPPV